MIKLYLAYYLDVLNDNQLEVIRHLGFETYEREDINRFRKEVKNKREILDVLNVLKNFEIVPGYSVQKDEFYYDFDENSSEKNEIISNEVGKEFLIFLLTLLEKEKESIAKSREKLGNIIESLSYDYMVQMNIWNKYGFARLYIKQEDKDIGFLDLINNWYKTEPEQETFFKDLLQDNRIKTLSKYFQKKEGYAAI